MASKYTTPEDVKKIEGLVAYYQRAIENVKNFSQGGKEGLKSALVVLKQLRDEWCRLKNTALDNPNHVRMLRALTYHGQEKGLDTAIGLFERPEEQVSYYEQQIQLLKLQLDEYKKLPKRN